MKLETKSQTTEIVIKIENQNDLYVFRMFLSATSMESRYVGDYFTIN